ncbi:MULTISPECIES: hypothetical protein [Aerosakkonema]|uniref:hypothetical protein n=1 Tax=Aerosakkonema TaxID=1246629 RepID=UPI0035B9746C
MQTTKSIGKVIAGAMLSLTVAIIGGQVVQGSENPVSLVKTTCVGSGPGRWRPDSEDVAIGRAVYKSLMNLSPSNGSAAVTCRIRPENSEPKFQTLQLEFGMLDRDTTSPPNTVNIYLDGRQVATRTVTAAQTASLLFNVVGVSNVSIETICSSSSEYCSRVYFFKASLERIPKPQRLNTSEPQRLNVPAPPPVRR